MKETAQHLSVYYDELSQHKTGFLPFYTDVDTYVRTVGPRTNGADLAGTRRGTKEVLKGSPRNMAKNLAAVLNGMLTSQSSQWFGLTINDKKLMDTQIVKIWLRDVSQVIYEALENSNFYMEMSKIYMDLVTYGTACLFIKESGRLDKELNFSARPINEYVVAENSEGIIDTLFRKFEFTARQMVMEFGKRYVSKEVKEAFDEKPETKFEVLHCVFPRKNTTGKRDKANKPFASTWIQLAEQKILRRDGYNSFPFVVPRWQTFTNELYGHSPLSMAIEDIKTLNEATKALIQAAQKIASPIILCPDEGVGEITGEPNTIVYYDTMTGAKPEKLDLSGNLPYTFEFVESIKNDIGECFYVNQLHMIKSDRMTATEINARQSENVKVLGPTFSTLNYEMLSPLIERVLDILGKSLDTDGNPMLPTPPTELQGKELKLTFTSPLAKSQKWHEAQSVLYTTQSALEWSQVNPTILDNINWDEAIKVVGSSNGTPPTIYNDKTVVDKIRQVRANQQAAMQQAAMEQANSGTAKANSQAVKNLANADKTIRKE